MQDFSFRCSTFAKGDTMWTPIPGAARYYHFYDRGVLFDGKIYVTGSFTTGEILDPVTKTWTKWPGWNALAYRPGANPCAVVITVNTIPNIYMCGGDWALAVCQRYSIAGGWEFVTNLPNDCIECTCVVSPTNRNQIIMSQSSAYSDAIIYDTLLGIQCWNSQKFLRQIHKIFITLGLKINHF